MTDKEIALKEFDRHITERYGGEAFRLAQHLEQATFMLFFLEGDKFTREEIQRTVYALKTLAEDIKPRRK